MYEVKAIVPSRFLAITEAKLLDALDSAYADEAQDVVKDYEKATATWENKPKFVITVKSNRITRTVSTDSKIFKFVDEGTRVRYAIMSNPFVSKTVPNWLGSRLGQGGVITIGKKPRPGIKPRNFTKLVAEKSKERMSARVNRKLSLLLQGK